jgi:hypothetical protein
MKIALHPTGLRAELKGKEHPPTIVQFVIQPSVMAIQDL